MRAEEGERDAGEARRQARLVGRTAGSYSGTQAEGHITAGDVISGTWTPYGRVGITEPKDGFLPRRTG